MTYSRKALRLGWLICGLAAAFYCYEYFLRIAPGVMVTDLMRAYNINAAAFGLMVAYYYHVYAPMQLPVGLLMDRYGPRMLLTVACLICAIGSYLFALTDSVMIASLGRVLVGLGSAFAFIGVLKLARIWLPANRFAMISGITSLLGVIGALSGNITMTSMLELMGWRNTIILSAALGVILAIIMFLIIRDHNPYAPTHPETEKVDSRKVLLEFIAIMKKPQMWLIGMVGFLLYLPTSSFAEIWGILYFKQAHGFSPLEAAYAVNAIFIGWGLAAPVVGLISDRLNNRCKPMLFGAILAAVLISIIVYVPGLPKWLIFVLLFVFGACYSVEVIVFAYACDICPSHASGTALAMTNMLVMLGGSFFQPIIGKMLDLHSTTDILAKGEHIFSVADYQFALSVLPIGMIIVSLMILWLKEPRVIKHHHNA